MIDFKKARIIKKLSGHQKLLIMESVEILRRTAYTCNDALSCTIRKIQYTTRNNINPLQFEFGNSPVNISSPPPHTFHFWNCPRSINK